MFPYLRLLFLVAFSAALLPVAPAAAQDGVRVVAGDTIIVGGRRWHLFGIEAPQPGTDCMPGGTQRDCGDAARQALADLMRGAEIECLATGDHYRGTPVGRCTADGFDLAANMLHAGWARIVDPDGRRYAAIEKAARDAGAGLWGDPSFAPNWVSRLTTDGRSIRP